ncbi:MAG TPA: hypothetical protein PK970_02680 [Hyphomicrobiaceae bacterium]|nr:hypothetical protein [Hyphomicrobiaceae bacterium]
MTTRVTRADAGTFSADKAEVRCKLARTPIVLNILLTAQGVDRLTSGTHAMRAMAPAFREGMAPRRNSGDSVARRSVVLGDTGLNDPQHWRWRDSDEGEQRIDGILLLYATSPQRLAELLSGEIDHLTRHGMRPTGRSETSERLVLQGKLAKTSPEPFGFKDGISQPILESDWRADVKHEALSDLGRRAVEQSVIRTGEILLGYRNERGAIAGAIGGDLSPLLRNGTYVVLRELHQNVDAFDSFAREAAKAHFGTDHGDHVTWVKERMVGRRHNGEMLTSTNEAPGIKAKRGSMPRQGTLDNDALFHPNDRYGLACPLGSHIRRANPRDSLGPDPGTAMRLGKLRRILRRSRLIAANGHSGMYFMALNADIAGQFEHIQQNWINNERFMGLAEEVDPLSHYRPRGKTQMTIQHRPFNIRLKDIPPFVSVHGGGYFFLPGLAALATIAANLSGRGAR